MKKHNFFKKTVCIAAAAAALFTSAAIPFPAAAADETNENSGSAYPTRLMNGDFEYPNIETAVDRMTGKLYNDGFDATYTSNNNNTYTVSNKEIVDNQDTDIIFSGGEIGDYGKHEEYYNPWFVTTNAIFDDIINDQKNGQTPEDAPDKFYWETTASDKRIELATATADHTSATKYFNDSSTNEAAHEDQFAELVGTEKSSLYQVISTPTEGNVLTWSLSHRARSKTQPDTMAVFIGPKQTDLTKDSKQAEDVFSMMALLITEHESGIGTNGKSPTVRTLYSSKVGEPDTPLDVGTVKTETHDQEWKCWIIRSDDDQWYNYSGSYTVPEGQEETTFAFTALNSGGSQSETDQTRLEGNCLDNIEFGVQYPLTVVTTDGGEGTVSGGGVPNVTVEHQKGYNGSAIVDSTVTITATPKTETYGQQTVEYEFLGAEINGEYVGIGGENGFTANENGSYTYNLKMDEGKHVELIFSPIGEVHYERNGGKWPSEHIDTPIVYKLNNNQNVEMSIAPEIKDQKFLHWEVYASDGTTSYNATVGTDHEITFDAGTKKFTIVDENDKTVIPVLEKADKYAIVLRAVYTQIVSVQPCTKYFGYDELKHDDPTGGTVTVSVKDENGTAQSGESAVNVEEGDTFIVTAEPAEGFEIISWWYEYTPDNSPTSVLTKIDGMAEGTRYEAKYSGSRNVTIHVQFSEIPLTPNLAVVAKDDNAETELDNAGIDTKHGAVSGTSYSNEAYGGDKYGNTIATGFFAKRTFEESTKLSGVWTVKIPAMNTYFKLDNLPESDYIQKTPVVEDDEAQINKGAIYEAVEDSTHKRQVSFYADMNTTVSGSGEVVFGIVIDNLYAPNAQAGFMAAKEQPTAMPALDGSNSVVATENYPYDQSGLDKID